MTETRDRTAALVSPPEERVHDAPTSPWNRRNPAVLAGLFGLVALLAAFSLPLAPVDVSRVDVQWPQSSSSVRSTALLLANQTPHSLELRFGGTDVEAASRTADGGLFATIRPELGVAAQDGLVVTATSTEVVVRSGGNVARGPWAASDQWLVHSDIHGLTVTRNGATVASWPTVLPPQVDGLLTSLTGASSTLSVHLQVVDDDASTASALKITLIVVLVVSVLLAFTFLWVDDRRRGPPRTRATVSGAACRKALGRFWAGGAWGADVLVLVGLVTWIFIGPMTDDDGYYAVMSLNNDAAGFVGNYYQLWNSTFTPFTWFWQFLDVWQRLGGRSPVWLRVPALLLALVAWVVARQFLARTVEQRSRLVHRLSPWFLAIVFLAWWFPYSIGARPEILGAAGTMVALSLTWRSLERHTLLPATAGALVAGLAFVAHPTGAVAFGPTLLAIPRLWGIARERATRLPVALARTVAVLSAGSVALLAAFWDGTLHDSVTAQERFRAVETPLTWMDEFTRYSFLMADIPMGSYAKRAVVLVTLVLLLWFLVLYAASRAGGRTAMPGRLSMTGFTCGLAFVLLWVTPSKWTHHFGAIATVGPLFVTAFALSAPAIARQLFRAGRWPVWLGLLAAASLLPPMLVSFYGPNSWAYSWYDAFFDSTLSPRVRGIALDSTALWVVLVVLVLLAVSLRSRPLRWRSTPAQAWVATSVVGVFFLVDLGFLTGTFVKTALPRDSAFSVASANLRDPSGSSCLIDDAVTVWDASSGTRLAPAATASDSGQGGPYTQGAAVGAGEPVPRTSSPIWSSYGSDRVGVTDSPWLVVPSGTSSEQRLGFLVAGGDPAHGGGQFGLEAGVLTNGAVTGVHPLAVPDVDPLFGWRSLTTDVPPAPGWGELVVRVVATDASVDPSDWGAFTEPVLVTPTSMRQRVAGQPTAVAWQSSFWFPCDRPPADADGIIEPPRWATSFGTKGIDAIWDVNRGGSLATAARLASVTTPASDLRGFGSGWGRLHEFEYPVALSAYTVTRSTVASFGWRSPFDTPSQIVRYEQSPPPSRH